MTIEAACTDRNFCLEAADGKYRLKRRHNYFYQCQGVMNLLNLDWINFVVFTKKDMHIERIHKDSFLWRSKMLPELTSFFVVIFCQSFRILLIVCQARSSGKSMKIQGNVFCFKNIKDDKELN